MRKHLGIMFIAVAMLTLAGCGSHGTSSAKKAVGHSFTSAKKVKTTSLLTGHTFKLKAGVLVVAATHNLSITDPAVSGGKLAAVVVEGRFTNRSKKSVTADSFFNQNFIAKQVSDDSVSPLQASSALQVETKYNKEIEAGISSKIKPGKTANFAIAWQFSNPNMLTDKMVIEYSGSSKRSSAELALKPQAEKIATGKKEPAAKTSSSASSAVAASSSSASATSSSATTAATSTTNNSTTSGAATNNNGGNSSSNYYTPRSRSRYSGTTSARSNNQYGTYSSTRSRTNTGAGSTQRSTTRAQSNTSSGSGDSGYGNDADDAQWYDPTQTAPGE